MKEDNMNGKRKLLLLGASYYQIPAITAAQKLGYHVIALDKNPFAAANPFADEAYTVDIVDAQSVLKVARTKKVDGVFTMQSDVAVPTVGFVNDQLGLSGIGHETAHICSDKIAMRQTLQKAGIYNKFYVATNLQMQ